MYHWVEYSCLGERRGYLKTHTEPQEMLIAPYCISFGCHSVFEQCFSNYFCLIRVVGINIIMVAKKPDLIGLIDFKCFLILVDFFISPWFLFPVQMSS